MPTITIIIYKAYLKEKLEIRGVTLMKKEDKLIIICKLRCEYILGIYS